MDYFSSLLHRASSSGSDITVKELMHIISFRGLLESDLSRIQDRRG